MKTILIAVAVLLCAGCANFDPSRMNPALMNASANYLNPNSVYGGYGYAQPAARMQTTCIQQGPWTQCY